MDREKEKRAKRAEKESEHRHQLNQVCEEPLRNAELDHPEDWDLLYGTVQSVPRLIADLMRLIVTVKALRHNFNRYLQIQRMVGKSLPNGEKITEQDLQEAFWLVGQQFQTLEIPEFSLGRMEVIWAERALWEKKKQRKK